MKATLEMIEAGAEAARKYMEETGGNNPAVIWDAMWAARPASKPLKMWTEAQHERAYRNSPELHKDVKSLAAFKRVAKKIAAMYGIKGDA